MRTVRDFNYHYEHLIMLSPSTESEKLKVNFICVEFSSVLISIVLVVFMSQQLVINILWQSFFFRQISSRLTEIQWTEERKSGVE